MPRPKKTEVEKVEDVEVTDTPVEEVSEPTTKSSKTEVTVSWRGNTRVYSKEVHGADFLALAKQFADKVQGEIV